MKISFWTVLVVVITIAFSCKKSKDDGAGNSYPKNVSIEYRITSPTLSTCYEVGYINEGGGQSSIDNVTLPFSKKFNRTVNRHDLLILKGAANGNGTLKLEILVNDKVELSTPFSGTSVVVGMSSYSFN